MRFQCWFLFYISHGLLLVLFVTVLLLCPQSWHSLPSPSSMGGRMGIFFPPAATDCLLGRCGKAPLLCSPQPRCSGVVSAQHPERLQRNCPKLRHRPPLLTAQRPCLMLPSVADPHWSLQGNGASGWGSCTEQGSREELGREEVAGNGDIRWGAMQRATARNKMFGSRWGQTCTANAVSFTLI